MKVEMPISWGKAIHIPLAQRVGIAVVTDLGIYDFFDPPKKEDGRGIYLQRRAKERKLLKTRCGMRR